MSYQIIVLHREYIYELYSKYKFPMGTDQIIVKLNDFIEKMLRNIHSDESGIIFLSNPNTNAYFNFSGFCYEKSDDDVQLNTKNLQFHKLSIKTSSIKIGIYSHFFKKI